MNINVQTKSGIPIYEQIERQIKEAREIADALPAVFKELADYETCANCF